ncbi:hypothetical protein NUH88_21980 [Nisaea acidiphila]|uniref:Uncharacterized protein n=1 Tax=Nisaea acidiphila TaxID=1862145 RepID=A0A9J7AUP8_9PROT|nr:hypothetical protein [Nisaea acidiphila]UUX50044.1 hypothetical protein NUH88_21980 [Nisaea acidiphila]
MRRKTVGIAKLGTVLLSAGILLLSASPVNAAENAEGGTILTGILIFVGLAAVIYTGSQAFNRAIRETIENGFRARFITRRDALTTAKAIFVGTAGVLFLAAAFIPEVMNDVNKLGNLAPNSGDSAGSPSEETPIKNIMAITAAAVISMLVSQDFQLNPFTWLRRMLLHAASIPEEFHRLTDAVASVVPRDADFFDMLGSDSLLGSQNCRSPEKMREAPKPEDPCPSPGHFQKPFGSIERQWAVNYYLMWRLSQREQFGQAGEFFKDAAIDWPGLKRSFALNWQRVRALNEAQSGKQPQSNPDDGLVPDRELVKTELTHLLDRVCQAFAALLLSANDNDEDVWSDLQYLGANGLEDKRFYPDPVRPLVLLLAVVPGSIAIGAMLPPAFLWLSGLFVNWKGAIGYLSGNIQTDHILYWVFYGLFAFFLPVMIFLVGQKVSYSLSGKILDRTTGVVVASLMGVVFSVAGMSFLFTQLSGTWATPPDVVLRMAPWGAGAGVYAGAVVFFLNRLRRDRRYLIREAWDVRVEEPVRRWPHSSSSWKMTWWKHGTALFAGLFIVNLAPILSLTSEKLHAGAPADIEHILVKYAAYCSWERELTRLVLDVPTVCRAVDLFPFRHDDAVSDRDIFDAVWKSRTPSDTQMRSAELLTQITEYRRRFTPAESQNAQAAGTQHLMKPGLLATETADASAGKPRKSFDTLELDEFPRKTRGTVSVLLGDARKILHLSRQEHRTAIMALEYLEAQGPLPVTPRWRSDFFHLVHASQGYSAPNDRLGARIQYAFWRKPQAQSLSIQDALVGISIGKSTALRPLDTELGTFFWAQAVLTKVQIGFIILMLSSFTYYSLSRFNIGLHRGSLNEVSPEAWRTRSLRDLYFNPGRHRYDEGSGS